MSLGGFITGVCLILSGVALGWLAWLGSQRRLPRNHLAGIRVRSTMADDRAWYAAHEAAAGPLGLSGGVAAAGGIAVLAVGVDDAIGLTVVGVTVVALLVGVAISCRAGVRAARSAD